LNVRFIRNASEIGRAALAYDEMRAAQVRAQAQGCPAGCRVIRNVSSMSPQAPTGFAGAGLLQVRAFALIPCGDGLQPPCASLAQGLRP
jgi:hypothetical protein